MFVICICIVLLKEKEKEKARQLYFAERSETVMHTRRLEQLFAIWNRLGKMRRRVKARESPPLFDTRV